MGIGKSLITAFVVLLVAAGITIGVGMLQWSAWVIMLTIIYFTAIEMLDPDKIVSTIVGGLVGITLGFGPVLLGLALAPMLGVNTTIVCLVLYLLIMLAAITCTVMMQLTIALNNMTWLFVIVISMVPGANGPANIIPDYVMFIGVAIVLYIVTALMKSSASKQQNIQK